MIRRNAALVLIAALLWLGALPMTASAEIRDVTWRIAAVRGVAPPDVGRTSFTLSGDGRLSATVGCNRLGGQAAVGAGTLSMGPLIGTRRACDAPLMDAEQRFGDAIAMVRSWRQAGERLELLDGSGTVVITLQRE